MNNSEWIAKVRECSDGFEVYTDTVLIKQFDVREEHEARILAKSVNQAITTAVEDATKELKAELEYARSTMNEKSKWFLEFQMRDERITDLERQLSESEESCALMVEALEALKGNCVAERGFPHTCLELLACKAISDYRQKIGEK